MSSVDTEQKSEPALKPKAKSKPIKQPPSVPSDKIVDKNNDVNKDVKKKKPAGRNCDTLNPYIVELKRVKYPEIKFGGGSKTYFSQIAIAFAARLLKVAGDAALSQGRITILEKDIVGAVNNIQKPFGFFDHKTLVVKCTPVFKRTNKVPKNGEAPPKKKGKSKQSPKEGQQSEIPKGIKKTKTGRVTKKKAVAKH